jgi:hypothetical protein
MSYSIRQSQVIHTWPAGSIIDLPKLSLIMLCHDDNSTDWGEGKTRQIINDPRLSLAFNVENFVSPPISHEQSTLRIGTSRFPRAQYCSNPNCGKITISVRSLGEKDYNSQMKPFKCDCGQELIPMRFVIATEEGFLDDFPWDWYVHSECPNERGKDNQLYYFQRGGSAGLQDIEIISRNSNGIIARRNLGDIFDQEIFTKNCPVHGNYLQYVKGKLSKPWLGWWGNSNDGYDFKKEIVGSVPNNENLKVGDELSSIAKRKFPRTIQRGAGNIFFPIIYSGIRLPEESYNTSCPDIVEKLLINKIASLKEDSPENYADNSNAEWRAYFLNVIKNSNHSLLNLGYSKEQIITFIESYFDKNNEVINTISPLELREQEFNAFTGDIYDSKDVWFKKRDIISKNFDNSFLEKFVTQIILIEKLSVLKVYRGFTRIKPLMNEELIFANDGNDLQGDQLIEYQRIQDSRKDPINTKELPAIEVKGEGIFIQFNNKILNEWSEIYPDNRINIINSNLQRANITFNQNQSDINKRYLLLHTLSHVILKELADDCGYGLTSLAEIIYCSSNESIDLEFEMNGVLIYTTTPDSEGSLGGLVEKGNPKYLANLIKKAVDKARWCSSDPLCISAENGQGFLGLNLAACYSCVLLPEPSCEKMNKYLDRAALIGTLENPEIGFFNLFG